MRYECERCHATLFTTNPPHLCNTSGKDLKKRYERQKKAVDKITSILRYEAPTIVSLLSEEELEETALKIVKAVSGLGDLGVG